MLSRRQFISGAAVSAGAGMAPGFVSRAAAAALDGGKTNPVAVPRTGPVNLTRADFAPHVGSPFRVRLSPIRRISVTLTEATDGAPKSPGRSGARGEAFSLLFAGARRTAFAQETYRVDHAAMGDLTLFLVPVGRPGRTQTYQAVFDHRTGG
jgi:hypothetical protein